MYKKAIEIWFLFYKHHTNETYVFDGKDGMHLKQLIKKITSKVEQKGMEANEVNVINSLKGFLNSIKDRWILDHLEISLINSKFNSLYYEAVRSNPFTSADRISDIVERRNTQGAGQ